MVRYIFHLTNSEKYFLLADLSSVFHRLTNILIFIFFAELLKKESEKTVENFIEIVESAKHNPFEDQLLLLFMMIRVKSKKYSIENIFFSIDWKVLIAVSVYQLSSVLSHNVKFLDFFNKLNLFGHHLSS